MKFKSILTLVAGLTALFLSGCVRPVEPKELVTAEANETMFVIPLQGENKSNQAQFNSIEYFNQHKVAVKQILVPHYWLNTGRWESTNTGRWENSVKIIKVNRSPVTVEFAVSEKGEARKKDADAIWIESADSVGFSTGFSVSALIAEEDTATFLYRYPSSSLAQVLSTEVRARIQQNAAEFAAKYPLDALRSKKNEMLDFIKTDVVKFYKDRGITITTVGQFGGFTYENPKIQDAIDNVFVSQQQKENAAALLAAQKDVNAKSDSAAQQDKANAITAANGAAQAIEIKAKADAAAIRLVAEATKEAASNPLYLEVRKIEIESKKLDKWSGNVPTTLIEGTGQSGMNLFLTPAAK